ncbi:hypothetical protein MMC12_002286 [Toensbergia leucococca]|nr:hypothetical protein [Toensbergia leucococca]
MVATIDPLGSFTFLIDNLPSWTTKLDELSVRVADQHSESVRITSTTSLRKNHVSTESLRPIENDGTAAKTTENPIPSHEKNPSIKEPRRKRKPTSLMSGASGPQKYRTRSMVIVHYDSIIQESFELLVRNIAGARNNLRKARTAASLKARMASLESDAASDNFVVLSVKMMQPRLAENRTGPNVRNEHHSSAYDVIDKELEAAQNLCEVAAHQFLRDGDCSDEIEGTRTSFEMCLQVAQREAEIIRKDEEQKALQQDQISEETRSFDIVEKVEEYMPKPIEGVETGAIEVDDDSDASSIHIDLSALRRTRRV